MRLCSPRVCNPASLRTRSRSLHTVYHAFITDRAGEMMELEAGPSPSRRDRERDPRPQVRRRAEPSPLGPLHRERGVARGAGDRAQPRPLDGAPRARRGNRDDEDAQAALLRSRRTAHPFCPALDPAPPEALALGWPVDSRARATPGATAPRLTPRPQRWPRVRGSHQHARARLAHPRAVAQRPRATLSDRSSLRPAPGPARRTPAHPPNSPPARQPAPSSFRSVDSGLAPIHR